MKRIILFLFLTIFTQIGGLVYVFSKLIIRQFGMQKSRSRFPIYLLCYLLITLVIIPLIAPLFGRVTLPVFTNTNSNLKAGSYIGVLANRHYVKPELKNLLLDVASKLDDGITLVYLDANFPFFENFPLLPHKSHDDGEKVDLAFIYQAGDQSFLNKAKGILGYGVVEPPMGNEVDQTATCEKRGYWQYGIITKIVAWFGKSNKYQFSAVQNKKLLQILAKHKAVGKIFIEPHLKERLGLSRFRKIRFHGCAAVRHDDHIHVQL